jgi:hypothetical protein
VNLFNWLKPKPAELLTPSVIFLITANLVPLYGVFFLHWKVFPILILFWMENVIVGIFNVFRMLLASPANPVGWAAKVLMIPFFCFHYGLFTFVHGIFVFVFFGYYLNSGDDFLNANSLLRAIGDFQLGWTFLALFLSHAISFTVNYIGKGEYKQANLNTLMSQPYSRVVVLHITILAGGFFVMSLGSPICALLILILFKTFVDIQAHLREHKKYENKPVEAQVLVR